MTERRLQNGLTVRGDSLYCPLPVSLDCYWNCVHDCHHCYFRRLNATWGQELRPLDTDVAIRKLENGMKASRPRSPLANALAVKKTLRMGNKSEPFQPPERQYRVARTMLEYLQSVNWETVIQTRDSEQMMEYEDILLRNISTFIYMPIVSPGYESDWEVFEKSSTTPPSVRLRHLRYLQKRGMRAGVNGEPFIPGYHTLDQFREMMRVLKNFRVRSYNTYNLHFNAFVAKRLAAIGIDIERIFYYNEDDSRWKPIQAQLIEIAKEHDIVLGCPDFVNSGDYHQPCNTCCGVNVDNPCLWNAHTWKRMLQEGTSRSEIERLTWDGVGDREEGRKVLNGSSREFYTLKDAGL